MITSDQGQERSIAARIAIFERGAESRGSITGASVPSASTSPTKAAATRLAGAPRSKVLEAAARFQAKARSAGSSSGEGASSSVSQPPRPVAVRTGRMSNPAELFKAMLSLEAATQAELGDLEALQAAIQQARDAGVLPYKVKEFSTIAERWLQAREQLRLALEEDWPLESLDGAIAQAKRLKFGCAELSAALKKSARQRLRAARASEEISALETGISIARSAGLEDEEVAVHESLLCSLRWAAAQQRLQLAVEEKDVEAIDEALVEDYAYLDQCKVHEARCLRTSLMASLAALEAAMSSPGDVASLWEAIQKAKEAGMRERTVQEYEIFAARWEAVLGQLRQAVEQDLGLEILQAAIHRARCAKFECIELTAALRRSSAMQISEALQSNDLSLLEAGIALGQSCGVAAAELRRAEGELQQRRRRAAQLQLQQALEKQSISVLQDAIDRYHLLLEADALAEARRQLFTLRLADTARTVAATPYRRHIEALRQLLEQAEVEDLEAQETLAWAEENVMEDLCDICFEEGETGALPCCMRDMGGCRICSACLARILQDESPCPFCRGAMV